MAVYGVGAYYEEDVSKEFIKNECFCIGHGKSDATTLYEMLRRAKVGDIIYIKSFNPKTKNRLTVKAIGFIIGKSIKEFYYTNGKSMGSGRFVKWVKDYSGDVRHLDLDDNDRINNVYSNTIYEEYSSNIITSLIDWIIEK